MTQECRQPRQKKAQQTRKSLLDAARKLFAQCGYAGTSVRAINRSVGMADGLMYHYFPGGKKELFQVILKESLEQMQQAIWEKNAQYDESSLPLEEVLDQLFQNFDQILSCHLDLFQIVLRENEVREFMNREAFLPILERRRKWLPELLRSRHERGEIGAIDYESAAEVLMCMMLHHVTAKLLGISPTKLDYPEKRRTLICYQTNLWKNVSSPDKTNMQNL